MTDQGAKYSTALQAIAQARGFKNVKTINRPTIGKGRGIEIRTRIGVHAIGILHAYNESEIVKIERDLWARGYHPRQRVQT